MKEALKVVLGLGSNCGEREDAVLKAAEWLLSFLEDGVASGIYETPPAWHTGAPYINGVVRGSFPGSLEMLDGMCKKYEIEHGRDEQARLENRVPIDIDVVIAGDKIMRPKDYACSFFKIGYSQLLKKGDEAK